MYSKSGEQIMKQMCHWFLDYHNKSVDAFDGTEQFTFFEKVSGELQTMLAGRINFNQDELPVFILKVDKSEWIINTTSRFIRLAGSTIEHLDYTVFDWHAGFKSIGAKIDSGGLTTIKTDGYVAEFGLKKINGDIIFWRIPTGKSGFAFWNVTKKCELIGRKYIS